jgi:light-regulated signal transduction histidine kinase (bacteriophytochrome)
MPKNSHAPDEASLLASAQIPIDELKEAVNTRTIELQERTARSEKLNKAMVNLLEDLQETNQQLHEANQKLKATSMELQAANNELEAFTYSVSHDLRAPLRSIDGFSLAVIEDYAEKLDATGVDFLQRVRSASQEMGQLIDDLLSLSRMTRQALKKESVHLGKVAEHVVAELREQDPERSVAFTTSGELTVNADPRLMRVVLYNLIANAWKFTKHTEAPAIKFSSIDKDGQTTYRIEDNGAGFDMLYVDKLFAPFQRLHRTAEFSGTGIGLATVQRVIRRHGGTVWAAGAVGKGATFSFTLSPE